MNYLNKLLLSLVLGVVFVSPKLQAQEEGRDRIKSLKIAFISEKLALTPKEAEKFWPIYNEHEDTADLLRQKERKYFGRNSADAATLSDAQASQLLKELEAMHEERYKSGKVYVQKLKTAIPEKKIILLLKTEENFKRKLIQQFRLRRGN
ncbi:sensor of ECF-type sigma factor [Flavobacterium sp. ASW18X]|uniref:sensor of ECF-type sigma factor n=1 Tax=Flavobacterium sp. ASW18X TaxID=2572595 RepID=UPI0010AE767C|nr:sensor of ECF-type sigma factor [Flavobacterium sp. ASW18X]TKD60674.1 sensor of ECF-type sigma factor [Flavobacterium sp. ASW18X]